MSSISPTISSTGVGSGLDVNSIVTALMNVEQRPLTLLQSKGSTIQTEISAFGSLKSQLANLGDVATRLAKPDSWKAYSATSSDSSVATVSAGAKAAAGEHTLSVSQMAQAQVLASGTFASSASTVGTGKLTIEIGTTANGAFTAKSGTSPVSVTIDSAHQTLAGVRDAINAAGSGVTASIVNGTGGARLVLRSATGEASSVRISATDDDGNNTDASGLSALAYDPAATAGAGRNLTQTQAAQDAQFQIDGIDLTSATNSPSDALEGVTLSLNKVSTDPVTINVNVDTASVRKNVTDFVSAYNGIVTLLQKQTKADPTGAARGALQGDSTADTLLNTLHNMLHGTVSGLGNGVSNLATAGITLQRDGTLAVDDAKLSPLLSQPDQLSALFSQAGTGDAQGFAVRFQSWAQGLTGTGGTLDSRIDGLKQSADLNQKSQDSEQTRLDSMETRLRTQYQQLDTTMSTLNAQMAQMKSALGLS
ncbi:flagellar filament capping protein FliD [Ramlibacter sp. G-1-2-2]|uniref:Flagellar hook-associated protein 2 n=1 Tax=Ramlibacter agri TaxID=2728837 RepID=A0A848GXW1_9BURK|nr:flagellar filament capping protein FliD [Ramlibacter agri]NML43415.1 flagellar filament capping protein FliD [Ramlibacter agri]